MIQKKLNYNKNSLKSQISIKRKENYIDLKLSNQLKDGKTYRKTYKTLNNDLIMYYIF